MSLRSWRVVIALVALAGVVSACSDSSAVTTTVAPADTTTSESPSTTSTVPPPPASVAAPPTTTTTVPPTTTTVELGLVPEEVAVPEQLIGLELTTVAVDGNVLLVAIADTSAKRRQGLMAVTDLLDLDGMLFTWTRDTGGSFWMRDTVLPLDIAFFTVDGALVNTFPMEPCDLGTACPRYESGGDYRYALETDQGRLEDLTEASTLTLPDSLGSS